MEMWQIIKYYIHTKAINITRFYYLSKTNLSGVNKAQAYMRVMVYYASIFLAQISADRMCILANMIANFAAFIFVLYHIFDDVQ